MDSTIAFNQQLALELYQSIEEFPVDFEDAWNWLGYSKKQQAKEKLFRNFEKELDFQVFTEVSVNSTQQGLHNLGGRPKEIIKLTIDCFKSMGMMAGTEKGRQIRIYFLECERIAKATPKTQLEMLLQSVQQMVEVERRQKELEASHQSLKADVLEIKKIQSDAERELKALPPAIKPVPSRTTRNNLNTLIRDYCHATGVKHNEVWSKLYREFRDRFHVALNVRAANGKCAPLDMAESLDLMEDLYALACELFRKN